MQPRAGGPISELGGWGYGGVASGRNLKGYPLGVIEELPPLTPILDSSPTLDTGFLNFLIACVK